MASKKDINRRLVRYIKHIHDTTNGRIVTIQAKSFERYIGFDEEVTRHYIGKFLLKLEEKKFLEPFRKKSPKIYKTNRFFWNKNLLEVEKEMVKKKIY